jgi:hypothetical protein
VLLAIFAIIFNLEGAERNTKSKKEVFQIFPSSLDVFIGGSV